MSTIKDRIYACALFAAATVAVVGVAHVALTYKLVPRSETVASNHHALRAAARDASR